MRKKRRKFYVWLTTSLALLVLTLCALRLYLDYRSWQPTFNDIIQETLRQNLDNE